MAKKKTSASKGKKTPTKATATKAAILKEVLAHLGAARDGLAKLDLEPLSTTQRQDSNGKLRKNEETAMANILDTMDAFPEVFVSLADKDGGVDDAKVETGPTRAHLEHWMALAPIASEIDAMSTEVSDALLLAAQSAKEVTIAGYGIIRANAPQNPKLAKKASRALAFYGGPAKKRAQNAAKAARAAKKKKAPAAT